MGTGSPARRLAAVLAADVAGYTRLMEEDTDGTVLSWQAARSEAIVPTLAQHNGRIVKLTGDGFLAEFAAVQAAVECAVELQRALSSNALKFRIGINLGDILDDGEDIHGEGVNIAARIEALAEPGSICVSAGAYEQVRNRVGYRFADLGEFDVKHVSAPVRVYRILADNVEAQSTMKEEPQLPVKPSIAVLPFDNMSGDPEQTFFVDGIVEDILTTLSKIPKLFVVARNSSFQYRDSSRDLRQVGRELNVRYVVEGSVRKAGNRVRVTAQLIDCADGQHLWADRYDGVLDDVFELQDQLTQEIVTKLEVNTTEGEQVGAWRKRSGSPLVYEAYLKGRNLYGEFGRDTHKLAYRHFQEALKINPSYTPAMALLGYTLVDQARFGWVPDRDHSFEKALEIYERAVKVEPDYGLVHTIACYAYTYLERHDEAVAAAKLAVEHGHNDAGGHHMAAIANINAGNFEVGRDLELQYARLSPLDLEYSLVELGRAQYHLGHYEAARENSRRVTQTKPLWLTAQTLYLASLVRLGLAQEVEEVRKRILHSHSSFSVGRWANALYYRDPAHLNDLVKPLLEAGLPD